LLTIIGFAIKETNIIQIFTGAVAGQFCIFWLLILWSGLVAVV
jgi:hypothetical protein